MSQNPYTQSIETKLYFVVLILFGSFLSLVVYNASIDTGVTGDLESTNASRRFRGHLKQIRAAENTAAPEIQ